MNRAEEWSSKGGETHLGQNPAYRPSARPFPVDSGAKQDKRQLQGLLGNFAPRFRSIKMAKPTTIKIRLNSTAGTGHFYVTKKNARTMTEKMVVNKYDPVVRKHVEYKEGKIK